MGGTHSTQLVGEPREYWGDDKVCFRTPCLAYGNFQVEVSPQFQNSGCMHLDAPSTQPKLHLFLELPFVPHHISRTTHRSITTAQTQILHMLPFPHFLNQSSHQLLPISPSSYLFDPFISLLLHCYP